MLFDNLQREKVFKREGYLCFLLARLSKFSCTSLREIKLTCMLPVASYWIFAGPHEAVNWISTASNFDRDTLQEGDVLVSNHPQLAGGSHLPDITVITPVFDGGKIVFFVASRGHHADVGGITPGSMPPHRYTQI
jgi:hypothetical protein